MKQFDLEQSIMECWNVTSDIDMILECYDELSEDSLLNLLIGMKEMYQLRFDKLFRTFEEMLAEQKEEKEKKYQDLLKNKNEHLHFDENTLADYDTMLKSVHTYEHDSSNYYYAVNTSIPNIPTIDLADAPAITVTVSP